MVIHWFNDRKIRQKIFFNTLHNCEYVVEPQSIVKFNVCGSGYFIKQWENGTVLISEIHGEESECWTALDKYNKELQGEE